MNEQLQGVDGAVAREWLAAIVDSSDDAIVSKTLDGIIQSWNSAAERIFGFTAAEAIGQSITLIIPKERLDEETMILDSIRNGRKVDHFQTVRQRKDGSRLHISLTVSPIRDAHGNIIGASKVARDITAQITSEADRRATERLRAHLAAIVQSSDDAIVSKDLNGIIQSWNAGAERIFGYTPQQAVGQSIRMIIPADLQHEEDTILAKIRRGERIEHFETIRQHRDGRRLTVSLTVSPIRDINGEVIGASKVARDITALKLADEALHRNEKLAVTGRLAASIAHEINNPLEAVTNLIFLAEGAVRDPKPLAYLQQAQQELARIAHITHHTLRFHRQTTHPTLVDLPALLDSVLAIYAGRIRDAHVDVCLDYRDPNPIRTFESELRQVFANLIGNAIDALQAKPTRRLILRVRNASAPGRPPGVLVSIADTGSGIPASLQRTLFQPFHSTKGNNGTGLGLWVSKGIIDKQGGTIRVRSKCGAGTVFRVFIPNAAEHPAPPPRPVALEAAC